MATSEEGKFCKKLLLDQQQNVEGLQNACRKIQLAPAAEKASPLVISVLEGMLPVVKSILEAQKYVKIACFHGVGVASDYLEESSALSLNDREKKKLDEVLKKRKSTEVRPFQHGGFKRRYVTENPSDICKSCGEVGHWWNNPKCKNYPGPGPTRRKN